MSGPFKRFRELYYPEETKRKGGCWGTGVSDVFPRSETKPARHIPRPLGPISGGRVKRGRGAAADALVNASDPSFRKFTQPVADLADKILPGGAANKFLDVYYSGIGALGNLLGGKSDSQRHQEWLDEQEAKQAAAAAEYAAQERRQAKAVHGDNIPPELEAALAEGEQTRDWKDYNELRNQLFEGKKEADIAANSKARSAALGAAEARRLAAAQADPGYQDNEARLRDPEGYLRNKRAQAAENSAPVQSKWTPGFVPAQPPGRGRGLRTRAKRQKVRRG